MFFHNKESYGTIRSKYITCCLVCFWFGHSSFLKIYKQKAKKMVNVTKTLPSHELNQQQNQSITKKTPWNAIPEAIPDSIFALSSQFSLDTHPDRVNLTIGMYQNACGISTEQSSVRLSRLSLQDSNSTTSPSPHLYLSPAGDSTFLSLSSSLLLPTCSSYTILSSTQTIGGSGALRIACDFAYRFLSCRHAYISQPTWDNHKSICEDSHLSIHTYRYYDECTKSIRCDWSTTDLENAPNNSLIILQVCGHNPTGMDFNNSNWLSILSIVEQRQLLVLFDCAYHGLVSGDLMKDTECIRLFAKRVPCFIAQSFSKIMGLYGQRIGNLCITKPTLTSYKNNNDLNVHGQILRIIRTSYSSPSAYGAQIVNGVLKHDELRSRWKTELKSISERMCNMRNLLVDTLNQNDQNTYHHRWEYIRKGDGMFVMLSLKPVEIKLLRDMYHVYIAQDSRINLGALTVFNVGHVAHSILQVVNR